MKRLERLFFCGVSSLEEYQYLIGKDVGGILLYPKIFEDPSEFFEMIYRVEGRNILLSTDHEGGQIEVIPFVPPSPGNLLFGRVEPSYVQNYCSMAGRFMKDLGMNMVFAPVLDLLFSETNPVIGYRSYGSDPQIVAQMGKAAIQGYRMAGLYSCAKHFPGHGRSRQDSHEDLSVVDVPLEELEKDLYPFKVAIQNYVDSIMLSHVIYKAIDDKPASISEKIIKQLLREDLGYNGLILSDAVEMKALSNKYRPSDVVTDFFNASGDMIILSDPRNLKIYSEALESALISGKLCRSFLDQKIERIDHLTKKIESNITSIFEAIHKSVVFNVNKFKCKSVVLVLPDSVLYTKADVSSSYISVIESQARKNLNAKVIRFSQIASVQENETVVDLIVDLTPEEVALHRKLSEKFKVIYVITRNPYLAKNFTDKDHVITYSLTPLVMGLVFRR
ncbi:MAG TPA: glycoside hydrolase family 3 N-terminal domain-containing protein, partial [Pseudothermotoga sp.]